MIENPLEAALNVGRLFYRGLSEPEKEAAGKLFREMDSDHDYRVTMNEVIIFLNNKGVLWADACKAFVGMDLVCDSYLSIEDVVALWHVFVMRPWCDGCGAMIMGMYYSCVVCHEAHDIWKDGADTETYDLCPECFGSEELWHKHGLFLDNFILLRMKNKLASKREEKSKENLVEAVLNGGRFCYQALSDSEKDAAFNFTEIDGNGDGKVSVNEVISYITEKGTQSADACKVIKSMGLAGDRYLSTEDVGALWYISMMRPRCANCRASIMGMYYSCVECHNMSTNGGDKKTYDLCPRCYGSWHEHDHFLDNFALLRMKTELGQESAMSSSRGKGTQGSWRKRMRKVLKSIAKVSAQAAVGAAISSACNMM